ncbi:MAG: class I SAM-dependent methyltransferase [Alphaproteobacteria bacterium]
METRANVVAQAGYGSPHNVHAEVLACPRCHAGSLRMAGDKFRCPQCGFEGGYRNDVYLVMDDRSKSYFDELHGTMTAQNAKEGVNEVFYAKQFAYIEEILQPGMTIVDIGCGPSVGYRRPPGSLLIGVDPSYESIAVNRSVDLRIFGGAQALPIATASVDVVVCFYSIHHMIGSSISETRDNVSAAFREFKRIVKPGGKIVIFEVNPYWLFWAAEQLFWGLTRRLFGKAIDFYFWSRHGLKQLGRQYLGSAELETEHYRAPWRTTFPPAFSIQWLRMPFLLYPFHVARYSWTL